MAGAAAAVIVLLTRALAWISRHTFDREGRLDLVATSREARRIGRPVARYVLRRLPVPFGQDTMTASDRKDVLRLGIGVGAWGIRVGDGEPGGTHDREDSEGVIEAAVAEPPTQ